MEEPSAVPAVRAPSAAQTAVRQLHTAKCLPIFSAVPGVGVRLQCSRGTAPGQEETHSLQDQVKVRLSLKTQEPIGSSLAVQSRGQSILAPLAPCPKPGEQLSGTLCAKAGPIKVHSCCPESFPVLTFAIRRNRHSKETFTVMRPLGSWLNAPSEGTYSSQGGSHQHPVYDATVGTRSCGRAKGGSLPLPTPWPSRLSG